MAWTDVARYFLIFYCDIVVVVVIIVVLCIPKLFVQTVSDLFDQSMVLRSVIVCGDFE